MAKCTNSHTFLTHFKQYGTLTVYFVQSRSVVNSIHYQCLACMYCSIVYEQFPAFMVYNCCSSAVRLLSTKALLSSISSHFCLRLHVAQFAVAKSVRCRVNPVRKSLVHFR